jgi:hypothetical protein
MEGENAKGLSGMTSRKLGVAGINLRGFSGAMIGKRFVLHIAFNTAELREKALGIIKGMS